MGQEDGLVMDVLAGTASSDDVLDLVASLASALLGLDRDPLLDHIGSRDFSQIGE
ncbi:hypothetical protein [Arthrobacter sp. UYCu712]|uniref:hypothetical protein n=1 Tax=Arthrobacter sp. UYCu712 TaxID=3156340 RepID=UPI0033959042